MATLPLLRLSLPPHKTLNLKPHPISLKPELPHHPQPACPIPSFSLRSRPTHQRRQTITSASYNSTPVTDRLISAVAYFFPFFNGLQYGRFLFSKYPRTLGIVLEPFLPMLNLYRSVPYASYLAFLALYIGVVRNSAMSEYVRFNAMQAVVLDVLLVVPLMLQRIFNPGPRGLGFKLVEMSHNTIFIFVVTCFVYSLVCSVLGKTPHIPLVADASRRQF